MELGSGSSEITDRTIATRTTLVHDRSQQVKEASNEDDVARIDPSARTGHRIPSSDFDHRSSFCSSPLMSTQLANVLGGPQLRVSSETHHQMQAPESSRCALLPPRQQYSVVSGHGGRVHDRDDGGPRRNTPQGGRRKQCDRGLTPPGEQPRSICPVDG